MPMKPFVHLQQPPGSHLCGQTCVAMAARVTILEATLAVGKKGGTRTKDVLQGFRYFGINPKTDKLVRWNGMTRPPDFALLHIRYTHPEKPKKYHGHWALNWCGIIHDPEMTESGVYCGGNNGRFTAYIELEPGEITESPANRVE